MVIEPKGSTQIVPNIILRLLASPHLISLEFLFILSSHILLGVIDIGWVPKNSPTHNTIFSRSFVGIILAEYFSLRRWVDNIKMDLR
jgi:hypothetical protein